MVAGRLLSGLVLAVTALGPASAAVGQPVPEGLRRLEGHWVYAGGDGERQQRLDAIDATVRQMPWFMRVFARKRIRAATPIAPSYTVRVEDHRVTVQEDDDEVYASGWDGAPVTVPGVDADAGTLTRVLDGDALRCRVEETRGSGTQILRASPGGEEMTVRVIVASARLPSDITYTLTYRRAPSVQTSSSAP